MAHKKRRLYKLPGDIKRLERDLKIPYYNWAIIWNVDCYDRRRGKLENR